MEDFPEVANKFFKHEDFQDNPINLTFEGWKRVHNEDRTFKGVTRTWKENIKYVLRYSYPEWAIDTTTGEKRLDSNGNPFRNKYWMPEYPQGYTIQYQFAEGKMDSGSLPLFAAFCKLRPKPGDRITIKRTGKDKETKWAVRRNEVLPEIDFSDKELQPDNEIPF